MYKKCKEWQYLVCVGGRGNSLCHKMQYFRKCQCEPHFVMPRQSEMMPGHSYTTTSTPADILVDILITIIQPIAHGLNCPLECLQV